MKAQYIDLVLMVKDSNSVSRCFTANFCTEIRKDKSPDFSVEALCSRYLFSQPAARQLSSAYKCLTSVFGMGTGGPTWQSIRTLLDGCYPSFICQMLSHLTTLWVYQIFADLSTLFFRNLVTHTGFEPMLTAWEAAVLTTWPMGHWCTFRDSNPGPTD